MLHLPRSINTGVSGSVYMKSTNILAEKLYIGREIVKTQSIMHCV